MTLPEPDGEAPEVAPSAACRSCGASVADGQQWCLECGTATVPPRSGMGLRTIGAAGLLSLVLLGGAVAASYAALRDQAPPRATRVETVAQVTPAPSKEVPLPDQTTDIPSGDPLPPDDLTQPIDPVTIDPVPADPLPGPGGDIPAPPPAPKPEPVEILPATGAGSLYDPDLRAGASGDPQRALDGNTGSSWFVSTPAGAEMATGFLVDLSRSRSISRLRLVTKTPGFTLTIYGARGGVAPKTLLPDPQRPDDPVWTKLAQAGSVDGDGPEGVKDPVKPVEGDKAGDRRLDLELDLGDDRYRWVMLWVTVPPLAGPTVRFSEIQFWA